MWRCYSAEYCTRGMEPVFHASLFIEIMSLLSSVTDFCGCESLRKHRRLCRVPPACSGGPRWDGCLDESESWSSVLWETILFGMMRRLNTFGLHQGTVQCVLDLIHKAPESAIFLETVTLAQSRTVPCFSLSSHLNIQGLWLEAVHLGCKALI